MEEKLTLSMLIEAAIKEYERLHYSKSMIGHFKKDCRHFYEFVIKETRGDAFSEEIGARYLSEKFGYPPLYAGKLPRDVLEAVRCVRRLGEYQLFGAFRRQLSSQKETDWYLADKPIVTAYFTRAQTADNRESTKTLRLRYIKKFYDFLGFRELNGLTGVSALVISDYTLSLHGLAQTTIQQFLAGLRAYFRFVYKNGYCTQDWSSCVPKVRSRQNLTVPALWEQGEVELLLKSIDRNSFAGKRDYAVILLAVKLGLRSSDISCLRLDSLNWEKNEIEIVQHKTGGRIVHPLFDDVGWAIIDYIRYARPDVDTEFVFLKVCAPYKQINAKTVSDILKRHIRMCGIVKPSGSTKGIHSLRHAFARRLLEQGIPLSEVADIMGHVSYSSTTPYLKVDIEDLRKCSQPLPEVMSHA